MDSTTAVIASVTTGCWPAPTVPPTSRGRANCSPYRPHRNSPRRPRPQQPTIHACCHVRAPAAADACSSSRPSHAAASRMLREALSTAPHRPRSGSTPHDAVIADPKPHRHMPLCPALARQPPACAGSQEWPAIAAQILSTNLRSPRSCLHRPPRFTPKRSNRQPQLNVPNMPAAAKSP